MNKSARLYGFALASALSAAAQPVMADEIDDLFTAITSEYVAQIPKGETRKVYDNFCPKNPDIQSMIDYYVRINARDKNHMDELTKRLPGEQNVTNYVSSNYMMFSRSFPLKDWNYNSIVWDGEPMKFYSVIGGSWRVAPIFNVAPDRQAKPTGRLLMTFAIGDTYNLLDTDTPLYQTDCKNDNFCNDYLKGFNPFRKVLMIVREDGVCSASVYHANRVDNEYTENDVISRNELRLFAPHGNFRFEIMQKDWANDSQGIKGSFTYDLNTLTINGVRYKMIPANGPWNKSMWYLKGAGEYDQKWLYMYPIGNIDDIYVSSTHPKHHRADKVVVTIFGSRTIAGNEMVRRYVLYPVKEK